LIFSNGYDIFKNKVQPTDNTENNLVLMVQICSNEDHTTLEMKKRDAYLLTSQSVWTVDRKPLWALRGEWNEWC